ncbi:hypothetical protein MTR67_016808 [Solanum verrucosum]|uniref:Uncharacterized protein n=1 Tax=Solanum verrucosum TaxID=315347 RepID=A0AAF0TR54_SOLVR|nr:hypothetical protein MTR67_016808 [Solanum verrucosum]
MEGFNGHQDSSQHRSPVMYREDRMRSMGIRGLFLAEEVHLIRKYGKGRGEPMQMRNVDEKEGGNFRQMNNFGMKKNLMSPD